MEKTVLNMKADKKFNMEYIEIIQSEEATNEEKAIAKENLVIANDLLVKKIVSKYTKMATVAYDENDMYQEGAQGVLIAAEKFDLTKGYQFSTYAVWWIRQKISRGLTDLGRSVRIPVHMTEVMNKYYKFQQDFISQNGREATDDEVQMALELTDSQMEDIKNAVIMTDTKSLDVQVGEDQSTTILDFIEDNKTTSPEESMMQEQLSIDLDNVMTRCLDKREKAVLAERFGMGGNDPKTLEEVGEIFNVTKERIRQIEAKALRKLRFKNNKKVLEGYMYA